MNICLVSQEYPPETARGGIGTQTWNKARTLTRLGHSVHVLSTGAGNDAEPVETVRDGVTVHRMRSINKGIALYELVAYWYGYSWEVLRNLRQLTARVAFDVIDFAEYGAEGFAYQMDRTPYDWIPVTVQLHGPLSMFAKRIGWPELDSDLFRVGTFMEDYSIKNADALMACSANIADFTAEEHGVSRDGIDVVHCGVDAEAFTPPTAARESDRPAVLFVGNLALNKGLSVVFEAVLKLRERFPAIQLSMLGTGDSGLINRLKRRAAAEGAESSIEFLGFVGREDIPNLYRNATVFCSPAPHEVGVANVYIEAMACGCPLVACNTGGAPEAVQNGREGFLVPPHDVDATAEALGRIIGDPQLAKNLGAAGRRRTESYFAMDRYIDRVLATYRRAIANSERKLANLHSGASG